MIGKLIKFFFGIVSNSNSDLPHVTHWLIIPIDYFINPILKGIA